MEEIYQDGTAMPMEANDSRVAVIKEDYDMEFVDALYDFFGGSDTLSTTNPSSAASSVSSSSTKIDTKKNGNKKYQHCLNVKPIQEDLLGSSMYNGLSKVGVFVIDNFLKKETANKVHCMVKNLSSIQGFLHDPMSNTPGQGQFQQDRYRDDWISWLSGKEKGCDSIELLFKAFNDVVELFLKYSRTQGKLLKVTHKSQMQVSCFPTQSMGYKTHSDNPNNNGRILTFVYHCNSGYNARTHAGATRFYVNNNKYADVLPKYNRLVVYWSSSLLEILPCGNTLYSLTSWYFG